MPPGAAPHQHGLYGVPYGGPPFPVVSASPSMKESLPANSRLIDVVSPQLKGLRSIVDGLETDLFYAYTDDD